jgi:hypothetical protein
MAKPSNHFSFEDYERRTSAQFPVVKEWLFGPDPDPTYDRRDGMKLDQFAMTFVPDLVREYKRARAELHPNAGPRDGFARGHSMKMFELGRKLSVEIKRLFLSPRFEVRGYQLQGYTPMVIPRVLLEVMSPTIETSELREIGVPGETARRFEKVRVFDLAAATKASGGRPPTYDWPRLAEQLEKDKPVLTTEARLVAYCGKNVTTRSGKRAQKGGPNDKTIRDAISQFGMKKYIKPAA